MEKLDIRGSKYFNNGEEITKEDYQTIRNIMIKKAEYVRGVFLEEISIDDIPKKFREEISERVKKLGQYSD